ncbi:zinc ribbon domain-containing protein [Alkalihalophilus sp. As8PL]|uniref:Zinc ribbon domain-containing protein n=1 Tax=Alkalihalophilus sp. As8PL TaxID=3237103 RepID=A0AB39BQ92_9BACI
MKFCKECGSSLEGSKQFCPECGTPIGAEQINNGGNKKEETTYTQSVTNPTPQKKPLTKKQKISAISSLVAAILLFIGFQVGATVTDKDRKIEKFGEAILEGNSSRVMNMLHSDDPRLEITEERVNNLLTFINNNPSYYSAVMDSLKAQSQFVNNEGEHDEFYDYYSENIFYLQNSGKTALIYDRYDITVVPFFIEIETNYSDAVISINDEEIAVSDSEEFYLEYGPVMPGVYNVKSQYSNEYTLLESSTKLELVSPYYSDSYANLYLSGDYITINSDYSQLATDATLFINGEEVDFDLNDHVGPLSVDGELSVYAVLNFPWGEVKTEESAIFGNVNLALESPFTEGLKDELSDSLFEYAHDWANAYSSLDESQFSNVTPHYLEYVTNDFSRLQQNERIWVGEFVKAIFDLDSFDLSTNYEGEYVATVNTSLYFDSVTVSTDTDEFETELSENRWKYYLLYNEESREWLVNDYSSLYSVSHDNAKELVAKND